MTLLSESLTAKLLAFRDERDWRQFHTPRNLAASVAIEAGELLECFQWARDDELEALVARRREAIEDEIADIVILLNYLCSDLAVDVESIVGRKFAKNALKYPAELARGSAEKYDKLDGDRK